MLAMGLLSVPPDNCSHALDHGSDNILKRRKFIETAALLSLVSSAVPTAAWSTTIDPKTGIRLPDPGEIEGSIPVDWSDVENPFLSSTTSTSDDPNNNSLFSRLDQSPDSNFYRDPRFVEHVDDNAVKLMTDYISNVAVQPGDSVLDLCSSWVSHIDDSIAKRTTRISGLGMNTEELEHNPVLTDFLVQDLNETPLLGRYEDWYF
jgi:hypothetical protein